MLIDITLKITPEIIASSPKDKSLEGHLGTHFDVMNKDFPLEYTKRKGIIFDISDISGRDIAPEDIDLDKVEKDMFVAFYSGYIERVGYASKEYFKEHPQLSCKLIDKLLQKEISIIALDFAGIRRGSAHTPKDQYCADNGVFVIENLCSLKELVDRGGAFKVYTFPIKLTDITGLPCRVIAEI